MKVKLSKAKAKSEIDSFFKKKNFSHKEARKIKRIAMKHQIKLGKIRALFCKKCFSKLKGKLSITKTHKTIQCEKCNFKNKIKIS